MKSLEFHNRVAVLNSNGGVVRHVHAELASALVTGGAATIQEGGGRIRKVALTQPAGAFAQRIGPPSEPNAGGVRFYRWRYLEQSAARVVEHHPRCYWIE